MGIKCSLLGHSFTETTVEEEREEQGSEVLTTIKEIETCDRCGKERIVSENKEVTSLEAAEAAEETSEPDTTTETAGSTTSTPEPTTTGSTPTPDIDAAEDDAELIGEAESDSESDDSEPASTPEPTTTETSDEQPTAADDDAVILDDEDDEPDREPGEWPDDDEPDLQATQSDESEGTTADDSETDSATGTGSDTAPGEWPDEYGNEEVTKTAPEVEWPEEDQQSEPGWEPSESLTSNIDSAEVEPAGNATITVPEGEFECPECGFTTSVEESSLRAGDFCPDCHRGSLEHRADDETRKE